MSDLNAIEIAKITNRILQSGISTALVVDCYREQTIEITNIAPIFQYKNLLCGPAFLIQTPGKILPILHGLSYTKPGEILHIKNVCPDHREALLGDIILTECRSRGIAGVICEGYVRDTTVAKNLSIPLWAIGSTPFPAPLGDKKDILLRLDFRSNYWIFADNDGCVQVSNVSPKELFIKCILKKRKEDRYIERMKTHSLISLMNIDNYVKNAGTINVEF